MPDSYLLFIDNGMTDHDVTVADFVASYKSLDEAIDGAENKQFNNRSKIIAKFDGDNLIIVARDSDYCSSAYSHSFRPGWIDKWPDA